MSKNKTLKYKEALNGSDVMIGKKGQIAMEYFILTVFILVAVSIVFAFSFINYDQSMRIASANEALAKLANTIDLIYVRGEGNAGFTTLTLPNGMDGIEIMHKCRYPPPAQGTLSECKNETGGEADYGDLEFSAIKMGIQLIGGTSSMIKETKAVVWENIGDIASANYAGSGYTVRVSWTDTGLIKLEKV